MKRILSLVWVILLVWLAWQVAAANHQPKTYALWPMPSQFPAVNLPPNHAEYNQGINLSNHANLSDQFTYLPVMANYVPGLSFELVASGLIKPTVITHAGDTRLFVAEKRGVIYIIENGVLLSEPFLDIQDRVNSTADEQGIESIAFPPDFAVSRAFYVMYTGLVGDVHLSRFHAPAQTPNQANPDSETILLDIDQFDPIHNGADMAFGPHDGYLYIGMGDGGSVNDPHNMGQNPQTVKGKILRLNVTNVPTYTIPIDNPFVNDPTTLDEIWALGLRNPWRMSFDRLTHDLWITDVGEQSWEEINLQPADSPGGENYGWRCYEGLSPFNLDGCADISAFTFPIHVYPHVPAGACAITGGYRYRGNQYPGLYGAYFFADYCTGQLWTLTESNNQWQLNTLTPFPGFVSTFGEDANGELYLTNYFGGRIYRIRPISP